MGFNDLKYIDRFIRKEVEKNFNVSLSGMFKRHRKKVPLIGDYPILKRIVRIARECEKKFTDNQIYQALKYSLEWKGMTIGKSLWAKDLQKLSRGKLS